MAAPYYIELQIGRTDILFAMNTQNLSSVFGKPFSVGSDNFNVKNVTPHGDTTLHYDESTQFYVAWDEWTGSGTDAIDGMKTQLSRTFTVSLNKVLKDSQGNITMVDGGSFDARVVLQIYALGANTPGSNAPPTFGIGVDRIDPLFPDQQFVSPIQSVLDSLFPAIVIAVPLAAPLTWANTGVAVDANSSFVAFRIQLGTLGQEFNTRLFWQAFYNRFIPDHLNFNGQQHDFSAFITGDQVASLVQSSLDSGFARHQDTFRFHYYYYVNWAPDNGTAGVNFSFNGDALNACLPAGTDINYDVTGSVIFSLTAAASGTSMTANGHLDWSGSFWDEAECEIIIGFEAMLLLGGVGGKIAGPPGLIAGFAVGFIGGIIAGIVLMTVFVPDLPLQAGCSQSGHDFTCTQPLPLKIGNATPTFSSLFGASDGLILAGGLKDLPRILSVQATLSTQPFAWKAPAISCADVVPGILGELQANITYVARATASVSLTAVGPGTLKVFDVKLTIQDPAGVVTPNAITVSDYGSYSEIDVVVQPNTAYTKNPYGFGLFITSNAGAFFASIPPVPPLDQATIDQIMSGAAAQVSSC